MFGIGGQELVIIALLFLVIFGPGKIPQMARDFGRFVNEARRSIDEFKQELNVSQDEPENKKDKRPNRRPVQRRNESSGEQAKKKAWAEDMHDL